MTIRCKKCNFPNQEDATGIKAYCQDCREWTWRDEEKEKQRKL